MKSAVYKDYIGVSQSPRVVVWNTKTVKGADVPTSYLGLVLSKYPEQHVAAIRAVGLVRLRGPGVLREAVST